MKRNITQIVLILEIIAICVLHAIKINDQAKDSPQITEKQDIKFHDKDIFLRQLAINR